MLAEAPLLVSIAAVKIVIATFFIVASPRFKVLCLSVLSGIRSATRFIPYGNHFFKKFLVSGPFKTKDFSEK